MSREGRTLAETPPGVSDSPSAASACPAPRAGRPSTIPADEIRRLSAGGYGAAWIARKLGVARSSVYRALGAG